MDGPLTRGAGTVDVIPPQRVDTHQVHAIFDQGFDGRNSETYCRSSHEELSNLQFYFFLSTEYDIFIIAFRQDQV